MGTASTSSPCRRLSCIPPPPPPLVIAGRASWAPLAPPFPLSMSIVVHRGHRWLLPSMVSTIVVEVGTADSSPPLVDRVVDRCRGWALPGPPLFVNGCVGWDWHLSLPSSSSMVVEGGHQLAPPFFVVADRGGGHQRHLPSSGVIIHPPHVRMKGEGALRALGGFRCRLQAVSNRSSSTSTSSCGIYKYIINVVSLQD